MASSEPPQQVVIDAGPQGTGRSGHGHADALSVKLAFGSRPWLVDAGTFCYIGRGDERNTFRGTRAHNTLAVDGLDQSEADGPFAWNFIPETTAEIWIPGETFTLFAGSHSGYNASGASAGTVVLYFICTAASGWCVMSPRDAAAIFSRLHGTLRKTWKSPQEMVLPRLRKKSNPRAMGGAV